MHYVCYLEGHVDPFLIPCSKGLSFKEAITILHNIIARFNVIDAKVISNKFIYSIKTGIHEK